MFEGFLPAKAAARRERLAPLAAETRTLVFYESAHRIEEALADMVGASARSARAVLARELTKLFETVLDGTLADAAARRSPPIPTSARASSWCWCRARATMPTRSIVEGRRLYAKLSEHLPPSTAAKLAAELSGAPRKALYGGDRGRASSALATACDNARGGAGQTAAS